MEALTACLCVLGTLLPSFAHAQTKVTNALDVSFSSGSLVTICLVGALPVTAIVIIWTFFFYCICKNEYDYRKLYKELDKRERYLKRKQQRIKQAQQLNASGYHPTPVQFSLPTKAQHKDHSPANIPLSALGRRNDLKGGRPQAAMHGPRAPSLLPHDSRGSRSNEPAIARLPPHIGYRNLTEELKQQQQRNFRVSNTSDSSGSHAGGRSHDFDSHDGHAFHSSSPFNFQHVSPSRGYPVHLPPKDYPKSKIPAHSSNSSAFGQLSTWPQFK